MIWLSLVEESTGLANAIHRGWMGTEKRDTRDTSVTFMSIVKLRKFANVNLTTEKHGSMLSSLITEL